jgi:uncharacterized protein YbjT (DUF2867 family)
VDLLVLGGTGRFGGELLALLALRPEVDRVHALVRPRGTDGAGARLRVLELAGHRGERRQEEVHARGMPPPSISRRSSW